MSPKISVEIPKQILDDLQEHIGDEKKFVNLSDAIRTACRKMLDMMDEIDKRHGRLKDISKNPFSFSKRKGVSCKD